jgi:hypothetical protein
VLPRVQAIRYVTPLREGGSLPGIVEADDLGTYVAKFRGAGQGRKVLVAEVIVGELARRVGVQVPDLVVLQLDAMIARYEADEEVQDLLTASVGLNLGVDFLPGSFGFDAAASPDPRLAATIVWLDAFVANVDRTWRNPNLLMWHGRLWAIDHGAALYFHHSWPNGVAAAERFAAQPYDSSTHVLGAYAPEVPELHDDLVATVDAELIDDVLAQVPDEWLELPPGVSSVAGVRRAYAEHLTARLRRSASWLPGRTAS